MLIRKFKFEAKRRDNNGKIVILTEPNEEAIKKELTLNDERVLNYHADRDIKDYSVLQNTDYKSEEARAAYFYTRHRPLGYYVDFPNPQYVRIMMRVDPCRQNGLDDLCCNGSNESVCEDNTSI